MTLSNHDVANLCEIADTVAQYNCFEKRYDKVSVEFSQGITVNVNGCRYLFQYIYSDDASEFVKKVCQLARERGEKIHKIDDIVSNMLTQLEAENLIDLSGGCLSDVQALFGRLKEQVPKLNIPEGCYEKDDF